MITLIYANSNDQWIRSSSSSYSSALSGSNLILNSDSIGVVGQTLSSSTYYIRQYFVEFSYSRSAGQQAVSAYFRFDNSVTHGTNVARDTEIRVLDWGSTVNTSDWRTPSQLSGLETAGVLMRSDNYANGIATYAGHRTIRSQFTSSSSTLRYVLNTSRNRTQSTPSGVEYNSFLSSRTSGTDRDPQLVVGHHTLSRMTTVLAGQVQLSDGTWIVLERDSGMLDELQLTVKHRTTSGETTVYEFPAADEILENDNFRGAQGYGLCRDNDDNFFIVRPAYSNTTQIQVRGFTKGGGSSWTLTGQVSFNAVADHGNANIMQVVCAWHDVGSGRIVAYATRDWGQLGGAMESYYLLDSSKILTGQSGFVLDSGRGGDDGFTAKPAPAGPWSPLNGTGTLCDIVAAPDHERVGYLLSGERHALLGWNQSVSLGRYFIHSNGSQFNSFTFAFLDTSGGFSLYDPDAKARIIAVDGLSAAKITADDYSDWGLTMDRFSYNESNNNYSRIGRVRLSNESITSMPTASALSASSNWDAVYFTVDNSIWVYYFDVADSRRLMRTSISLDDNLATRTEVEVDAAVGNAGDTIHAIRVQRNNLTTDEILITVAKKSSGGAHEYEYIVDRINVAPTQPTLTPVTNFNANNSKQFSWTFRDPNLVDSQSAYQFRVIRQSDSVTVHDTGKVVSGVSNYTMPASSVANDVDYFWQVKTWDSVDAASAWSSQGSFSTSDAGVVDITEPATDLEEIFTKDVTVEWSLTGASQDDYRVVVVRTSDSATFLDTGWVTSSTQSHTVEDLVSDVEYEFRVKTRSSLVESNEATRLVLVHYNSPELPEVTVEVEPDREYVLVSVSNPEPRGDRPNPTINEVYRRVVGSGTKYLLVGECEPNGSFRDYSVGSGYDYEYKIRAGVEA